MQNNVKSAVIILKDLPNDNQNDVFISKVQEE